MSEEQIQEALQKGIRAARRGANEPARRLLGQVVQADPNNEEAWLWLSRVIETPEQRADCLQRALAINPDNRWASEQLAALQAGIAETPAPAAPTRQAPQEPAEELKLDLLQCPKCGGSLNLQSGARAKTLVCRHCGSVLDLTAEQAAVVGQMNQRARPSVPIELGAEGTFEGERHQVIGWLRYEGWDDEDRWRWDEWLLASSTGTFRWLSYDSEDGFLLQKQITPSQAFNPRAGVSIPVPGGAARITERSPARIIALTGELTWQAKVGERLNYVEARRGEMHYSVEYTKDEIELLEGRAISDLEVWQAFGRQDMVEKTIEDSRRRKQYRTMAAVCAFFILLGCAGIAFSMLTGRKLSSQEMKLTNEQTVGPFEITQPGRGHRISLKSGKLPTNNWAVVDVSMMDSKENEYYLFSAEFWDEEGRDSDGYWHEDDLNESFVFRPDAAGQYTLFVAMDEATVQSVDLTVTVRGGVWLSSYFILFAVICAGLAFLFAILGSGRTVDESSLSGQQVSKA